MSLLFITSLVFALLIGMMWQKINNLETGGVQVTSAKSAASGNVQQISKETQAIVKEVLPENYKLGVKFNDVVVKMVQLGAIDKDKFIKLYEDRSPLTDAQKKLFESTSLDEIVINQENAQLLLNILWPLGISNKAKVLSDGTMGSAQYKDKIGSFASTGGWSLGKIEGGKLFNSMTLIQLTPDQENTVKEIANNIYRPCCGNNTSFPDCNHGAAMLGFIELAVSQGMSKDEIYKKALVLNSYWFPQNYVEIATYLKTQKGISWNKANPKDVLGENYSSNKGYAVINKELQSEGVLPEIKSSGGCGV